MFTKDPTKAKRKADGELAMKRAKSRLHHADVEMVTADLSVQKGNAKSAAAHIAKARRALERVVASVVEAFEKIETARRNPP